MKYLKIGGKKLRLNLAMLSNLIQTETNPNDTIHHEDELTYENTSNTESKRKHTVITHPIEKRIDTTKYETIRLAMEIVLTTDVEVSKGNFDEVMDGLPYNVKIAINTLIAYRILEELK